MCLRVQALGVTVSPRVHPSLFLAMLVAANWCHRCLSPGSPGLCLPLSVPAPSQIHPKDRKPNAFLPSVNFPIYNLFLEEGHCPEGQATALLYAVESYR